MPKLYQILSIKKQSFNANVHKMIVSVLN